MMVIIEPRHAKHLLYVTRAARDKANRRAWDAAEDCFLEPTDTKAKARLAALTAESEEAQRVYDNVCSAAARIGVLA